MDFKIIENNKKGKCLLLDDFKYRKIRVNIRGNVVWRCYIKNCTSTVTIYNMQSIEEYTKNILKNLT